MSKTAPSLIPPEHFLNPPGAYRLHPMEHDLSEDNGNIGPFLRDTGAGGGVINAPWKDGWNHNPPNLQKLLDTARKMKDQGLRAWLYDDIWYPSGWAGGYIINAANAGGKHLGQVIGVLVEEGSGREKRALSLPDNGIRFVSAAVFRRGADGGWDYASPTAAHTEYAAVRADCPDGEWQLLAFYVRWGNSWPYCWCDTISWPNGPRGLLNFLNRDAVACFIKGALQPVADAAGEPLGNLFDAVFTDEPAPNAFFLLGPLNKSSFCSVPYGDELFDRFRELHGYALTEALPYLFFDGGVRAATARIHFYRTLADLLRRNFTGQVGAWCRGQGMRYSGHLLCEERLEWHAAYYGDYMEVLSEQDWPGYDCLEARHRYYWQSDGRGANFLSGKYASSVARGKGINDTMVEICPVNHQNEMLVDAEHIFDSFMSVTTDAIFTGATHIHVYAYRFIHDNGQFNRWNEYTGRLCAVLREAVSTAAVAVYYPVADAQAFLYAPDTAMDDISDRAKRLENYMENLTISLYENQFDFNFVTERMVLDAAVEDGGLRVCGTAYKALVFPSATVVPLAVMEKMEAFARAGGAVYFLDRLPSMGLRMEEQGAVGDAAARLSGGKAAEFRPDNLAFRAGVTASSTAEGYSPAVLTNGSAETWFCWECWRSETLPAALTLELEEPAAFNRIVLYTKGEYEQRQYRIEAQTANGWQLLADVSGNADTRISHDFPLITARRVRLTFEDGCEKQPEIAGLTEIQLYRVFSSPEESAWLSELRRVAPPALETEGCRPGSILLSHYRREERPFHFLINKDTEPQTFTLREHAGRALRIYDPESGAVTEGEAVPIVTLAPGRGLLVEPVPEPES